MQLLISSLRFSLILLLSLALLGCTGKIRPATELSEARAFLLLDFGTHTSLLLPRDEPGLEVRGYPLWSTWQVEPEGTH